MVVRLIRRSRRVSPRGLFVGRFGLRTVVGTRFRPCHILGEGRLIRAGVEHALHRVLLRRGHSQTVFVLDRDLPRDVFALVARVRRQPCRRVSAVLLSLEVRAHGQQIERIAGELPQRLVGQSRSSGLLRIGGGDEVVDVDSRRSAFIGIGITEVVVLEVTGGDCAPLRARLDHEVLEVAPERIFACVAAVVVDIGAPVEELWFIAGPIFLALDEEPFQLRACVPDFSESASRGEELLSSGSPDATSGPSCDGTSGETFSGSPGFSVPRTAAELAGREGTGSASAELPPPVDHAASLPAAWPASLSAHPESRARTTTPRRVAARTRVLRAKKSAIEELGTLGMIEPNRHVAAVRTHSLIDSLSASSDIRREFTDSPAEVPIHSRRRPHHDRGEKHSPGPHDGQERHPHLALPCSS